MKLNQYGMTTGWIFFTWACFVLSLVSAGYMVYTANIDPTTKAFFFISYLMVVQASISLSKMIRDKSEYDTVRDTK